MFSGYAKIDGGSSDDLANAQGSLVTVVVDDFVVVVVVVIPLFTVCLQVDGKADFHGTVGIVMSAKLPN